MQSVKRIFDIPYYQLETYPLEKSISTRYNGKWESLSTKDFIEKGNQISKGLFDMGIKKGDKIALITSRNRTEWNLLDMGALQIGAVTVPVYPTISVEDYEFILNHSEAIYIFISDESILEKLNKVKHKLPRLRGIFSFDEITDCANWKQVLEAGKVSTSQSQVEQIKSEVNPLDLASIIYTSGTTGRPKGVLISHQNLVSNVKASADRLNIKRGKSSAVSFLPCCHIYERMIMNMYFITGVSIYFSESLETVGENMKEVKPNIISIVPRVLEKMYDKIYSKGSELGLLKRMIFHWAVSVGEDFGKPNSNTSWYKFKLKWAKKLVYSKWAEALGGNIDCLSSGSAVLSKKLARIFAAAGMPVFEGYGLTETSPVLTVNDARNDGWRIGSVGKPVEGVEVKIAEDGEVLCKGLSVTKGYFKDEEKTNEAFTDGWFHTGDIGKIDKEGFLYITDRKKEMFKTSGGKYIAPQVLESVIKQSHFIEQIMVIGEGEKMPAAFIQLNFDFVKEWAKRKGYEIGKSFEEIINNELIINRVQKEISRINERFGNWEQIKKFEFTPNIWSVESGEITPTLKLKRKSILAKNIHLYNKIYNKK